MDEEIDEIRRRERRWHWLAAGIERPTVAWNSFSWWAHLTCAIGSSGATSGLVWLDRSGRARCTEGCRCTYPDPVRWRDNWPINYHLCTRYYYTARATHRNIHHSKGQFFWTDCCQPPAAVLCPVDCRRVGQRVHHVMIFGRFAQRRHRVHRIGC